MMAECRMPNAQPNAGMAQNGRFGQQFRRIKFSSFAQKLLVFFLMRQPHFYKRRPRGDGVLSQPVYKGNKFTALILILEHYLQRFTD